jgi:hypothetical protein
LNIGEENMDSEGGAVWQPVSIAAVDNSPIATSKRMCISLNVVDPCSATPEIRPA